MDREQRIAQNESIFRAANERIADWEERGGSDVAQELFLCECADGTCTQKLALSGSDYERVRSDPVQFFVLPGHEVADVETVVETHPDWLLVRKDDPEAREVAEETDPRQ
jgi:hypothetical protein